MYKRVIQPPKDKSFFLFGPRGTGKTTWLKSQFPKAIYLDLLEAEFVIQSNDQFHKISEKVREEIGTLDSKRIFFEWNEWLKKSIKRWNQKLKSSMALWNQINQDKI